MLSREDDRLTETQKRRHPRIPVLVDCRIEGASGRTEMRLTDLSPTGCFVDTAMTFPDGTPVLLYAMLGESEVAIPGRVVNIPSGSGFGFAIDLDQLQDSAREQLEAFIKERSS
jgi:PilZ domain